MSDDKGTPRTDDNESDAQIFEPTDRVVNASAVRTLERELQAAQAELERVRAHLSRSIGAEARSTVHLKYLTMYATALSDAIGHLPECLEGYLESLDAPLSEMREILAEIRDKPISTPAAIPKEE